MAAVALPMATLVDTVVIDRIIRARTMATMGNTTAIVPPREEVEFLQYLGEEATESVSVSGTRDYKDTGVVPCQEYMNRTRG